MRRTAVLVGVLLGLGACHRGEATSMSAASGAALPPSSSPLASSSDGDPPSPSSSSGEADASLLALGPDSSSPAPPDAESLAPALALSASSPFGPATPIPRYSCSVVLPGGPFRAFLAAADTKVAFVDGDDWLALVNRSPTGALPPGYAPTDLVDVRDGKPLPAAKCEGEHECLRKDAAEALHRMFDRMKGEGLQGRVESAFRGFHTQCWVFDGWAQKARGGFCEATAQSALPGHSQHQLGTTLDLFTSDWADEGFRKGQGVFRNGFGCTPGGKWLDENAWQFGFVVSYPIDPDDRKDGSRCVPRPDRAVPIDPKTGYKHEPWHLRFIGVEAAARYHHAWLASGPGTPREITLEQWLRASRGLVGDAELPVCDGCQCGACATMAAEGEKSPCGDASLRLGEDGRVVAPSEEPHLLEATAKSVDGAVVVEVSVHAPAHTPTQTPVTTADAAPYVEGATYEALMPYPETKPHRYADLPGAWRVAVEPEPPLRGKRWPWRASLAKADLSATWNRANLVLPAKAGDSKVHLRVTLPAGTRKLRVTLLRDGAEHDTRDVPLP